MTDDAYEALLADLSAEHDALDRIMAPLDDEAWELSTPAAGWTVRDQIGHLHHFDGTALLSATDPAAFVTTRDALIEALTDPAALDARTLAFARGATVGELLAAWRHDRVALVDALSGLRARDRLEWYGPSMSAMSFATARLMETWAHGQDVADAVGSVRTPTDRLHHIAHLGVRTRSFSYLLHGREEPPGQVRVELDAPSGGRWEWGPAEATDRVTGPALDFCLVVTQRRHPADTSLGITGPLAAEWLSIAQAFAGGPTLGPPAVT